MFVVKQLLKKYLCANVTVSDVVVVSFHACHSFNGCNKEMT